MLPFRDEIASLYAPFEGYVTGIAKLMLRHIWQLAKTHKCSAGQQLANVAWLARLITLDQRVRESTAENQVPHWPEIRAKITNLLDACKTDTQIDSTIDECMAMLRPILERRFVKNYCFPKRDFICWWYTIHRQETLVAIHLINGVQPGSPFDAFGSFAADMLRAIQDARSKFPNIKLVEIGSWLNQLPKFQQLWPDSFKNNQHILNRTGGFGPGAWGQYMTADGGFHFAKARSLLKTGHHPFFLTEAQCDADQTVAHLKELIVRLK